MTHLVAELCLWLCAWQDIQSFGHCIAACLHVMTGRIRGGEGGGEDQIENDLLFRTQ